MTPGRNRCTDDRTNRDGRARQRRGLPRLAGRAQPRRLPAVAPRRHARLRVVRRHAGGTIRHLRSPRHAGARRRPLERCGQGLGRSRPVGAEPGDLHRSGRWRPGLFHTAQPGGRQEECEVLFRPLARADGGGDPPRRGAHAGPAQGQLRARAGDAPRRRSLDAAALSLRTCSRRALDWQPRRRRRRGEQRPGGELVAGACAAVHRLRAHDHGAARRRRDGRVLPAPPGRFRLSHRER